MKFVQLNDSTLLPRLVQQWKELLNLLELMDVHCRVVKDGKYTPGDLDRYLYLYPVVYGCKCDFGVVHFCIDTENAMAKCLGLE